MLINDSRLQNITNAYQGKSKKVLCVCSAGLLRSPTTALVLSRAPYNYNTRAAGVYESYALIYADDVLLRWADEIVCMEKDHEKLIARRVEDMNITRKIICLDIKDAYEYRNPNLIKQIKEKYAKKSLTHKD